VIELRRKYFPALVTAINELAPRRDFDGVAEELHGLTGLAGLLQLHAIVDALKQCEEAAKIHDGARLTLTLRRLTEIIGSRSWSSAGT
jgi:HPt (histidine-containing phosphotransfer) domain-containing protein